MDERILEGAVLLDPGPEAGGEAPPEEQYRPAPRRDGPMGRFDRMLWDAALAVVRHQVLLKVISSRAALGETMRAGSRAGRR